MRVKLYFRPALAAACLAAALFAPPAAAQSDPGEGRPPKLFGSSLDRLRWDDGRNTAVESGRGRVREKRAEEAGEEVIRVETSLVVCDFLVLDRRGRPVEGLTPDDFVVTEDGAPQQVGTFVLGDSLAVPRSIVLIIDYSSSQFPFIRTSVEAARTLVDKLNPKDRMAIVTDDVELLVGFTRDRELLKKGLDALEKRTGARGDAAAAAGPRRFGRSAQYSALMATFREAFTPDDARPVVIFQTDGDEVELLRDTPVNPSVPPGLPPDLRKEQRRMVARMKRYRRDNLREFGLADVYAAAERSRATVYTVVPGFRLVGLAPDRQVEQLRAHHEKGLSAWADPVERERALARLEERYKRMPAEAARYWAGQAHEVQKALAGVAEITGGWTDFLEDPSQAPEVYARILSDINRRYVVGYYPSNRERDGRRREVKIEVRGHPDYTVWGRKSYYAPGPDD